MYIQKKIKFLLHKRHSHDTENLSIRMRVTLRGQTPIDFPTRLHVNLNQWDAKMQRVLPGNPDAESINRTIEKWLSDMSEIFARYELLEKRIPTPGEIKELFNDMIGRETKINKVLPSPTAEFFKIYDLFTSSMGKQNQWAQSTYINFRCLRKHIKEFNPHISIPIINENFMRNFIDYYERSGYRNTTIAKHISLFLWFLRWAAKKKYYNGNIHKTFKPKLKGVAIESKEIIFLSQEEIKLLQNHTFISKQRHLEQARDVFLFCCFTGLRYSDVAKLKRCDIKKGAIHIVTKKTLDALSIELNKYSQAILDKYKDNVYNKNLALPVVSNSRMNVYLKKIGQLCGLDEPTKIVYFNGNQRHEEVYPKWALLTTHCARRTFVITALQLGIPAEVIIRWTGHADYSSMRPYIKIVDDLKAKSMMLFNKL